MESEKVCTFAKESLKKDPIMAIATSIPQPSQMIVTLEPGTMASEIKRALKLIRGVASVREAKLSDDRHITPALYARIKKAREESARGETIVCNTPEEMQKYFDSL